MLKWLIFIFVGYLFYQYWRRSQVRQSRPDRKGGNVRGPERMVACAQCGVNLPESESVSDADGRSYCSEEHRRLGDKGSR